MFLQGRSTVRIDPPRSDSAKGLDERFLHFGPGSKSGDVGVSHGKNHSFQRQAASNILLIRNDSNLVVSCMLLF